MADAPKLQGTEKLGESYYKINMGIDNANEALNRSFQAESKSSGAINIANNAITKADSVQTQLNTIVISGDSGPEAAQARVDEFGNVFGSLKESIDTRIGVIELKSFGVKGDGITDETDKIRKALSKGGIIRFEKGKTYIYSTALKPPAGTVIEGNGATLKRINERRATVSSTINANGAAFSFTVDDASKFKVGMDIMFIDGANHSMDNHEIKSITGNQITVYNTRTFSFPSGSIVQSAAYALQMADDCVVKNLKFDGNRSNQTFVRWEHHQEIILNNRCKVEDCRILNAPGEAMVVFGTHGRIVNNFIDTCGGNGIHYSGATFTYTEGNYVINCNKTPGVGHEDGGIILSNQCSDLIINSNYIQSCKSGIGSIDYDGNSDLTITNNIIRNCAVMAFDIERYAPDGAPRNLIIQGNRVYNSVYFAVNNVSGDLNFPIKNTIVSGNYFFETNCRIVASDTILFENNTIEYSASGRSLEITNSTNIIAKGNLIKGGTFGVYLQGTSSRNILVSNNIITNQTTGGISMNDAPDDAVSLVNNTLESSASASSSYIGMNLKSKTSVNGNTIKVLQGQFGIVSASNNYIINNIIKTPNGIPSIKVYGGQTSTVMMNNMLTQPIAKPVGDTNTDVNNIIISA